MAWLYKLQELVASMLWTWDATRKFLAVTDVEKQTLAFRCVGMAGPMRARVSRRALRRVPTCHPRQTLGWLPSPPQQLDRALVSLKPIGLHRRS